MANYNSSHSGTTIDNAVTLVTGSKTKNYVLAAPANANGAPTFRALTAGDIPAPDVSISDSYNSTTKTVTLSAGSLGDADSTEY